MRLSLRPLLRLPWLLPWAALSCGLACLWASSGFQPEPLPGELSLRDDDFVLTRAPEEPLAVTEATWRPIPYLFGDFDLTCDVDLSPGAELDLLFRVVEPRLVQDVVLPFHTRFTLLRMSAGSEGPPYRTRSQALFDQTLTGGVDLAPGHPATVLLQGRGRMVRANVAGRWFPWVRTADESGSFAFVVRGGEARIPTLRIRPLNAGGGVPAWAVGAVLALVLAAGAAAVGGHVPRLFLMLPLVVAVAGIGKRMVLGDLQPLAVPETLTVLWIGLAGLPMAAMLALPLHSQRWALPLGLLAVFACWDVAARQEAPRRYGTEDPRLDLVFGRDSGTAPLEALARRVRGPYEVHTLAPAKGPRVFFLGGQLLYGLTPEQDLTVWSTAELGLKLQRSVEGMALPTVDGHALQQWLMFWGYYRDYAPDVLVFGIAAEEMAEDPRGSAEQLMEQTLIVTPDGFAAVPLEEATGLVSLLQQPAPAPRSTPESVARALREAQRYCESAGHHLVVLIAPGLPGELRAIVRAVAEEGIPTIDLEGGSLADSVRRVVGVLEPILR